MKHVLILIVIIVVNWLFYYDPLTTRMIASVVAGLATAFAWDRFAP